VLLRREDEGLILGMLLEPQEAFQKGLEVVAQPDARGTDPQPAETEFVGHALSAMRGVLQGVGEGWGLDLGGDAVRVGPTRPATRFDERLNAPTWKARRSS